MTTEKRLDVTPELTEVVKPLFKTIYKERLTPKALSAIIELAVTFGVDLLENETNECN